MPGDELTSLIHSKKSLLKPAARPRPEPASKPAAVSSDPPAQPAPAQPAPVEPAPAAAEDSVGMSSALERELCLAVNRELHAAYCYLSLAGVFTRHGLRCKIHG